MLFTRQRLLLNLLATLDGDVAARDFQKLLFLFSQEFEAAPSYEFVPYRFGCFSFSSYADKRKLIDAGLLASNDDRWQLTAQGRKAAQEKPVQAEALTRFVRRYGKLNGKKLVREVYTRYPYYAIRSEIVNDVLPDAAERKAVKAAKPAAAAPGLLTIGYEGKSLEHYLNQLLKAGVTVLCDVRRNPLSRKYGFSKNTLKPACERLGIRYEHLPELGIASDRRRELNEQADYDALFADYEKRDLPKQKLALQQIYRWINDDGERVALTCYELEPHQCHRHCVADAINRQNHLEPEHL